MPLKAVLAKLEDAPEGARSFYKASGTQFVMDLEGDLPDVVTLRAGLADSNGKLAEFRDNNRLLNTKVTDLESKLLRFDGVDPDEHRTLKTQAEKLKAKGVKTDDDLTTMLTTAIENATKPLREQIESISAGRKEADQRARDAALESEISSAAVKLGVHDWALPDFTSRAKRVFSKGEDGRTIAKDGTTPIFSPDKPTQPLSIEEYGLQLAEKAPGLFKSSQGGNSQPSGGAGGGGVRTVRTIQVPASQPLVLSETDRIAMTKGELRVERT